MFLPNLDFETNLWKKGINYIVGIDEVGRGSWAGPLVAAGVILPKTFKIPVGFADSKQLTQKSRESFSTFIQKIALGFFIAEVSSDQITKSGLTKTTQKVFSQIIKNIKPKQEYVLVDAFHIKYLPKSKQTAIIRGDEKCASIAAASIIAKVYRDNLMEKYSRLYPAYGFEKHKGYGTKLHQIAIKKHGFSQIHRTSYNLNFLFS